mmetsp:Transcript_5944/g.18417  ORF Transcript_5944/g.18417 Transcript_5944/m.18417 type:complete len:470 (+) Transcript_5944:141-1550(+)
MRNVIRSPAVGSLGSCGLLRVPMNRSPSKDSDWAKPQEPRKLLMKPESEAPTMFAGSRGPPLASPGAAPPMPMPMPAMPPRPIGRGERERSPAAPRPAAGMKAAMPWLAMVMPKAAAPSMPEAPEPAAVTFIASKPVCDLLVLLRATVNSTASPDFSGATRWALLRRPTKRSPSNFGQVMKPQVSWKLRTMPVNWRPTRSFSSAETTCTFVAWHLPLVPSEMSKVTESPALRAGSPGLEPWCRKRSPSKSSEMTKPQPSRKLRTVPAALWPTSASGACFGNPKPAVPRPSLGTVTAATAGAEAGIRMVCPSCFTFIAWMPVPPFWSLAIWNSTHSPCCRPVIMRCGFALTPTKTSPSKRFEFRRPHWSLKLLTQPRRVSPMRLCESSFTTEAFTAWYSPPDEVGSSATSRSTASPDMTGPSSGFDLAWMKRSPMKLSEFTKPHWSRKLFILPVTCCPTRWPTCARSAGP